MIDNALHVKPAGTQAHTVWHRDSPSWFHSPDEWEEADRVLWQKNRGSDKPFSKIKIFYFVDDVDEETGPFSIVPGSHKLPPGRAPQYEDLEDMPGHVKMVGKAGGAVLWNGHLYHTAMNNTDGKARKMLLYNYTHFGMKQHDPCVPKGVFRERMEREGSLLCKQLLGIERMDRAA